MVASVVGLFILSGAITVFTGNKTSQEMSTGLARIQENGRVALDILSNDLRLTGFQGCTNGTKVPDVISTIAPTINLPVSAMWGSEFDENSSWTTTLHADLTDIRTVPKPGTDVIYVQHGSGRTTMLASSMTDVNGPITLVTNPDQLDDGDLIMISDCANADIFRATKVDNPASDGTVSVEFSAASANTQSSLNHKYTVSGNPLTDNTVAIADPMRVMRFESNAYFVADSGREDRNGNTVYSLFVLDTASADNSPYKPVELVEGVENMQIVYGERLPSGALRYLPAGSAGLNMNNVVSIQIGILVTSADDATTNEDDRTYLLADVKVGPPGSSEDVVHAGGKQMRAAFNTTIQLRNRRL
jgi:type IV pilus assembly protein PilW